MENFNSKSPFFFRISSPVCHANLTDEAGDLRGKAGISQIPLADLCSRVRN